MKEAFFCACAVLSIAAPNAAASDLRVAGNRVLFNGPITETSAISVIAALRPGVDTLIINSPGGDAAAGQLIGFALAQREIHVEVQKYCLSACANYVFLAGKTKTLGQKAILGFHGGLISPRTSAPGRVVHSKWEDALNRLYATEELLFKMLAVDQALIQRSYDLTKPTKRTVVTRIAIRGEPPKEFAGEDVTDEMQALLDQATSGGKEFEIEVIFKNASTKTFYFPSRETLEQFGVGGIISYWQPRSAEELSSTAKNIPFELEVISDPQMQERRNVLHTAK